jgi:hypothetical protein
MLTAGAGSRLPAFDRRREHALDRMKQELMDTAAVAETDLGLGRVHVDVHRVEWQVDEQAVRGLHLVMQHVAVGFPQGMADQLVANEALIDEAILVVPAGAGKAGAGHPPAYPQATGDGLDGGGMLFEWLAQHMPHTQGRRFAIHAQLHTAIVGKRKRDLGTSQRQTAHRLGTMGIFGCLGLEKLAPCWRVEEQICRLDHRACAQRSRDRCTDMPTLGLHPPGMAVTAGAAGQTDSRHCGDRGQRLAAKSQAGDALEFLETGDFAGGMARQRERQFIAGDSAAIVRHPDTLDPALLQFDTDFARAGIDTVFQQFLQGRRGALDHLAGGDLRNQQIGKNVNRHAQAPKLTPRRAAIALPRRCRSAVPSVRRASGKTWVFSKSRWLRLSAMKRRAVGSSRRTE